MLFEYAVEPRAIGSSWQNFRYLIEKFGFDRGRLISRFPGKWEREVYAAAAQMKPIERARLEIALAQAKQTKFIRSGRPYDAAHGTWFQNAAAQHAISPFHAIIAEQNPTAIAGVVTVDEVDEQHPLMVSAHTWEVERVGTTLAVAMRPLLTSAKTVLFVDRFFDISRASYQETLKACLDVINASGAAGVRCEIHYCDHDKRPPPEFVEREAHKWIRGVLPTGMSFVLFGWKERAGGADFHARYLLTDVGGMNVEAGFSAEGAHQKVQLGLLSLDLTQSRLNALERKSAVYDLVDPVLEVRSDGSVHRI
ncbi:hypothetical protein [Methylocella tundrae]|uniref:Uncharacterized protein n=1 Tax=Methylocella tundrae TaxID=227605 RepID=A0A4U8Z7F7_METTU|nr:hypothetical protein [Methylocella tundrae]WPP02702.1 hypothetical protein SIN04_00895 [Methylocella tundrae]VFU17364.1 conserved protein of unknown function [Methylocella tundrae]